MSCNRGVTHMATSIFFWNKCTWRQRKIWMQQKDAIPYIHEVHQVLIWNGALSIGDRIFERNCCFCTSKVCWMLTLLFKILFFINNAICYILYYHVTFNQRQYILLSVFKHFLPEFETLDLPYCVRKRKLTDIIKIWLIKCFI